VRLAGFLRTHTPRPPSLMATRAAVYALFASFGLVIATWAVHLPNLKQATGITTALLGTVVLILGIGALVGMQLSGPLIDRFGSQPVAIAGGSVMAVAVAVPLAATTFTEAAVAAFFFGVATGSGDVAMNAAAVEVERRYGRPILASFHGVFSVGTVFGSLVSAAGFALHVGVLAVAIGVGAACLVVVGCAAAVLLRQRERVSTETADPARPLSTPDSPPTARERRPRRVYVLALLSFLLFVVEGSAMDWSSLHAQQHLNASPTWGSIAFGSFVTAMMVGRFTVDGLAARIGPVQVFRWGSTVAFIGLAIVVLSPVLPLTLVGWVITGLGLAGGMPQVFTAAGNVGGSSGRSLALVVGVGYAAILGGPAIIGWVAEHLTLNTALVIPLAALFLCGLLAAAVKPRGA
jgi:MFS family permease